MAKQIFFVSQFLLLGLGQEDYPEIVGKCLDLRLIRKKLGVKNKYKKYKQFFKDLIRVFDNQKRYQQRGTRLYKHADLLQRLTRKLISRFKKDVNMKMHSDEARVDQISFEQREELGKKIIKLTKQSLSKLIEYLREHHSLCIEDDDEIDCSSPKENQAVEKDLSGRLDGQKDRIMIVRINELDKNRFMKVQGFVDELINRYYKIYGHRLGLNPENTLII
ncbi:hypothetical protein FGO68_gene7255 [Halteria grandinella]|uniref:Bromo domain-containing protein n=1 Tax=Halteria grandinella TaxID=5974 RepID=A0A8J8NM94_HALGN|nr:hypothetical protein FGO68_gene7255 [Halteria grandinella]